MPRGGLKSNHQGYHHLAIEAAKLGLEPVSDEVAIQYCRKLGLTRKAKYWWKSGRGEIPLLAKLAVAYLIYREKELNTWQGKSLLLK